MQTKLAVQPAAPWQKEVQANKRAGHAAEAHVANYKQYEYYPEEQSYPMAAPVFTKDHFPKLIPTQWSTPGPSRLPTPGPEEWGSGLHPYFRTGMGQIPKLTPKYLGHNVRSTSLLSRIEPLPLSVRIDAIPEEDVIMMTFEDHKILSSHKYAKSQVIQHDKVSL